MQNDELPVTFHCNTVNDIFWLHLNDSLKRALAALVGIAQHSLCMAIYVFLDLRVFMGLFILGMSRVL